MVGVAQRSFLGGEVTETIWARTDQSKRAYGCSHIGNFAVTAQGGLANRSGTAIVAATRDGATKRARIIPFIFGGTDSVLLELGNGNMRFSVAGVPMTVTISADAPAYSATKSYSIGGMASSANVIYYCIAPTLGNAPPNAAYWSALTMNSTTVGVFEIPTPWTDTEVFTLDYDGYADVRFFFCAGHPVYQLKRVSASAPVAWTLTPADFAPSIAAPSNVQTSSSGSGTNRRYKVTAIKKKTDEQSLPGNGAVTYTGGVANTGTGGIIKVTVANALTNGNSIYVLRAIPQGNPDAAFEAAVVGRAFVASGVTGAKFELTGTAGITVASNYQLLCLPLTVGVTVNVLTGALNGGGTANFAPDITGHGLVTGDEIFCIATVLNSGSPNPIADKALAGKTWRVTKIDADNFTLDDSSGPAYTGNLDGYFVKTAVTDDGGSVPGAGAQVTLTWDVVPDAKEYWVYKQLVSGAYGFLGVAETATYFDDNKTSEQVPLSPDGPPRYLDPTHLSYPVAGALLQQRLVLAGGSTTPTEVHLSQPANVFNFAQRQPVVDSDGFFFDVLGYTVEAIRHLVTVDGKLLILTAGDVWLMGGNADGTITLDAPNLGQVAFFGSGTLQPLRIGRSVLFADRFQSRIHDLSFDAQSGGFVPADLSLFAPHLVEGHSFADWAYQQFPDSTVYLPRDDGTGMGMTYDRARNVWAWFRLTTGASGKFKSFAALPEADGIVLYAVVYRTINGSAVQNIERFYPRKLGRDTYSVASDAHFVDCEQSFNGAADGTTHLTITTATSYAAGQTLTITASTVPAGTTIFHSWDVGNRIIIRNGASTITITITAFTSATVVSGTSTSAVTAGPPSLQNTATIDWTRYYHVIGGITALEAVGLAVLGDTTDDTVNQTALRTVTSGVATLGGYYVVVRAGIPIDASFSTIGVDSGDAPQRKSTTPTLSLLVQQSRGWKAGPDADNLGKYGLPAGSASTDLIDGWITMELNTPSERHGGGFTVSQKAPLPMCAMAAIADLVVGGK